MKCYQCGIVLLNGMLVVSTGMAGEMLCKNCWDILKGKDSLPCDCGRCTLPKERIEEYAKEVFPMSTIVVRWVKEDEWGYGKAMRVIVSPHKRFIVGSRFDFGFFSIATDEGYTIISLPMTEAK